MATTGVVYDTDTGKYLARPIATAEIADAAITSAKIASGIIGGVHLNDATIKSAAIASGTIGGVHIKDTSIVSAGLAAALIAAIDAPGADGATTSAKIASGAVGSVHLKDGTIVSADVASGTLGGTHMRNQSLVSANIGANIIDASHIANQGVKSANIAAGIIDGSHILDGGIKSAEIASGQIGDSHIASGTAIDIAETIKENDLYAGEIVSSYQCVYLMASGYVGVAKADDAAKMPSIGMAGVGNIASGDPIATVWTWGGVGGDTGVLSGQVGKVAFVATVGDLTLSAPAASGNIQQRMGVVCDGEVYLEPSPVLVQIAS